MGFEAHGAGSPKRLVDASVFEGRIQQRVFVFEPAVNEPSDRRSLHGRRPRTR